MNKYILIVDNSNLTPYFSDKVINCIRDNIGIYNMVGKSEYFTICFTHSYDLQRLTDKLMGLFSNHKTNAFNLFLVDTHGWNGFDTDDNLQFYKKFDRYKKETL